MILLQLLIDAIFLTTTLSDGMYGLPSAFALDRTTGNLYVATISHYVDYYQDSFIAVVSPTGGDKILYDEGAYLGDIVIHPEKG